MVELKGMTMDELAGAVHMYPWYGGARKELCRRMSRSGGESWGTAQYAGEAVYIADRRGIADLIRRGRDEDWSDRDVERILKSYISRGVQTSYREEAPVAPKVEPPRRSIPGGDYFSAEAYESVSREDDDAVSRIDFCNGFFQHVDEFIGIVICKQAAGLELRLLAEKQFRSFKNALSHRTMARDHDSFHCDKYLSICFKYIIN